MPQSAAFFFQRLQGDALQAFCRGKIEGGRRNGEARRVHLEKLGDDAIGHLVVASSPNAVNILVRQKEPEKQGKGQRRGAMRRWW